MARTYLRQRQNFTGQHFWARGYYVSTVGRDEATIREYIKKQEAEDQRLDQLNIFARERHLQVAGGFPTALSGSHLSSHRLCRW